MKADFTRDTFHPARHYSLVLYQQGRVQLDADFNEQAAILLHALRETTRALVGPRGVPCNPGGSPTDGFLVTPEIGLALGIGTGVLFVDGILVENHEATTYAGQPDLPSPPALHAGTWLIYLDVWERLVTWIGDPELREVALGGPDTAARAQVVWQVKATPFGAEPNLTATMLEVEAEQAIVAVHPDSTALLAARARSDDICTDGRAEPPGSAYRGTENQLYRVEIHTGGPLDEATFKWSRDNGSVVFRVTEVSGPVITVADLGLDETLPFEPGDWVELVDDDYVLNGLSEPLLEVRDVDRVRRTVTLAKAPIAGRGESGAGHPLLRRWDHHPPPGTTTVDGALAVSTQSSGPDGWLDLENGVQVQFSPAASTTTFDTGEWWLVPARVATGTVEWPEDPATHEPVPLRPWGITHQYAPLALVAFDDDGHPAPTPPFADLRRVMVELTRPI